MASSSTVVSLRQPDTIVAANMLRRGYGNRRTALCDPCRTDEFSYEPSYEFPRVPG